MTVLVAVNTRDAIVLAADSQGTITRPLVDPKDLSGFFDTTNGKKLLTDEKGHPLLDTWSHIASHSIDLPYKIHHNVEKIFSLEPLSMGIMASGIGSIGDRTIKSLVNEFKTTATFSQLVPENPTLKKTAEALLAFLWAEYSGVYPYGKGPDMELMLCGFDADRHTPGVIRIHINKNTANTADYDFCIFFGGITREIQRMLFGIDAVNKGRLMKRSQQLLGKYREHIRHFLKNNNIEAELPAIEELGNDFSLFNGLELDTLQMNCATYSEQDAIECAEFLINVMINSQRFSNQIPTTGGKVQIAIIRKQAGFQFITSG